LEERVAAVLDDVTLGEPEEASMPPAAADKKEASSWVETAAAAAPSGRDKSATRAVSKPLPKVGSSTTSKRRSKRI
jgi:hypothetical protein